MRSYRFARRSFLTAIGGAVGLEIMMRNLEAAAQGAKSPARMLFMHYPIGTLQRSFIPGGSPTAPTLGPMLAPFQPLMSDMIITYGHRDALSCPGGGGHEAGTPFTTTGANAPGTRANGGEGDDGVAGGPSFDQVFLKNFATQLKRPGDGYISTLADARVDSLETSTQCLCYDYVTRSISAANGGSITEHTPLLPQLQPLSGYTKLFSGFVPGTGGGTTPGTNNAMVNALYGRKSVLDFARRELAQLSSICPADQRQKIESHVAAIRTMEETLQAQIAQATANTGGSGAGGSGGSGGGNGNANCKVPAEPDKALKGPSSSKFNYGNEKTSTSDEVSHENIGKAHAAVIKAAFQCDIIRVATFQWSPGTNHVSFKGLYGSDGLSYMHHPMSHRIADQGFFNGPVLTGTDANSNLYQFLVKVAAWYNQKTADILMDLKNSTDSFGNSLLDYTVVPYLTEVGDPSHSRNGKGSFIFGGKALGIKGGQYINVSQRPQVDVWLAVAQALTGNADPLSLLPTSEKFVRSGAAPLVGAWAKPA